MRKKGGVGIWIKNENHLMFRLRLVAKDWIFRCISDYVLSEQ